MDRPQYLSTKALRDQKQLEPFLLRAGVEKNELAMWNYSHRILEIGQKFLLPEDGLYFDDCDPQHYIDNFRLPFKQTVLEFHLKPLGQARINKMLVAATEMEMEHTDNDVVLKHLRLGQPCAYDKPTTAAQVFAWIFCWNEWVPLPVCGFIPYANLGEKRVALDDIHFWNWAPVLSNVKFLVDKATSDGRSMEQVATNSMKVAMMSLLQTVAVLNCSNVRHELVKEPKFINMKRMAKGEPKLDSYRILMVDDREKTRYDHEDHEPTGAKRRQHVRRGHIRRYQTGKTIWINQMIVGKDNPVKAHKDYKVRH